MLPGLAKRLAEFQSTANRDAMRPRCARSQGCGARRRARQEATSEDAAKFYDWFNRVMAAASPQDEAWRDLASILGMSRMLAHIGSAPAVRELIGHLPWFWGAAPGRCRAPGEGLARALGRPTHRAQAGRGQEPAALGAKMLDVLGKTVPGEAVQTADNQVLADVLRAYGHTKDTDAARVIVSFANSDRIAGPRSGARGGQIARRKRDSGSFASRTKIWWERRLPRTGTGRRWQASFLQLTTSRGCRRCSRSWTKGSPRKERQARCDGKRVRPRARARSRLRSPTGDGPRATSIWPTR